MARVISSPTSSSRSSNASRSVDTRGRFSDNVARTRFFCSSSSDSSRSFAGGLTHQPLSPVHAALGAVAFGLPFLVIALVSPAGMGMGDAKLAGFIGLVLGSLGLRYVAVAAALGILAGGLASATALAAGRSRKSTIPFGPWLALGAIGATFFAPAIARMYLGRP